ncbi:MAG TPA: N-acetylmuramoyl-L-alanine amidase [Symbiobacteriaceae bacterium]
MQRDFSRRVAVVGLALLLVWAVSGSAALAQRTDLAVQAELTDARRWLSGTVVILDPGHGGEDPGAVVGETLEKTVVLEISMALKQMLEQQGVTVVLTRTEDTNLGGTIREELGKRVALAGRHKAHVYVSIHANKDACNCWGAQTFYQKDGLPAGKELALAIQNQFRLLTPTTRTVLPADYFVLRNSPVAAAMVEVGFLTHDREHRQLKDPTYQRTVATAIALGLADYFKAQVPNANAGGSLGR